MGKVFLFITTLLLVFSVGVFSQTRDRKINGTSLKNCRVFLNGKLLNNPKPIYPLEAKSGGISGKVEVAVEIDEKGKVIEIESTNGNEILAKAAAEAAKQAVFSPTTCDGKATKTVGVITYNFPPIDLIREFFKPSKIEDFIDIAEKTNYYESVLFLTENYRIAFGYADQKFHPELPLSKGDFAHFLRQMLEMLDSRGKLAQKNPKEIGLYQSYNPDNLKEIEFNPTAPYSESFKILSQKYKIILANPDGSFDGDTLLTKQQIVEIWQKVFGEETVPINFLGANDGDKEMTRGDFAIYLKEALDVLTYKILP